MPWNPYTQTYTPDAPVKNTGLTPEEAADFERRAREEELKNKDLERRLKEQEAPQAQEQARIDRARTERAKDLGEGRARGEQLFGEGSLGRISPELLDQLRAQSKGFSPEEQNAMRDQNLSTINQSNAANIRNLKIQQAQSGVRGGQAVAQIAKAKSDQGGQIAASERELFLKNIDARRSGQKELLGAEQYTNEQKNRERMAQITTELGYGALGSADRGAAMQAVIGQQQAAAAARSGGGGGKK